MSERASMRRIPSVEDAVKGAYPVLYRAALVLCDNAADAEDAVQETLARAIAAYPSFRGESSPATWMCRILARVASEHRRRRRPSQPLSDRQSVIPASLPEPEKRLELREDLRAVLEALRSLPERQREAATLFYLDDLSYQEVASTLGISIGTVKSALCRARMAIRATLRTRGKEGAQ